MVVLGGVEASYERGTPVAKRRESQPGAAEAPILRSTAWNLLDIEPPFPSWVEPSHPQKDLGALVRTLKVLS